MIRFAILPFLTLISCSPAQVQRLQDACPVPELRAALAVAEVAVEVASAACDASPREGCREKVDTARGLINDSDATLDKVCEVAPLIEAVECQECEKPVAALRKAACK